MYINMSQLFRDTTNKNVTPVSKLMRSMNDRGLRKREITPTRNSSYLSIPNVCGGDRYVGMRKSEQDLELANHLMNQPVDSTFNTSNSAPSSPVKTSEQDQMKKLMRVKSAGNLTDAADDDRILCYKKNMAPLPAVGHINQAKPSSSVKKSARHIPLHSERILDAPDFKDSIYNSPQIYMTIFTLNIVICDLSLIPFLDDYYMNVLDWSSIGVVAVALSYTLYLWNADTGDINILLEMDSSNEMNLITSVKWSHDGKFLAVGFKDGTLRLYDPNRIVPPGGKLELRTMRIPRQSRSGLFHYARIYVNIRVLCWRGAVVSAGYQSGQIIHHDVRVSNHVTGVWEGHEREVVGLHWSPNEMKLASGSGDNTVRVWDESRLGSSTSECLFNLNEHEGSVRAVQFCNFKSSLLATGGGMQCKSIKLWNINSGEMLKSIDTGSAVINLFICLCMSSILYLFMFKLSFLGHSPERAISIVPSPCGQYVMTAGADETLRMWRPFKVDKSTQKLAQRNKVLGGMNIR
uniref:WD_REPEATS_REGION domain-containing protein n=1 Tax=Heterorhabditis bacteriophora TaxID=37862 RepID=A0A1I7WXA3_HETBA